MLLITVCNSMVSTKYTLEKNCNFQENKTAIKN